MMSCQNLAVPAEVMKHVVNVESSKNPFAIGVVGGQLVRQPQNLPEAVATVRMLESRGYNYSLGIAQVNRSNLGKYGLDTYEKAFEYCPNLVAGSRILAQCYASAGKDWGKAFSCYYSGNFTTGYEHGYVQRIFDSMSRDATFARAQPIPLQTTVPVRVARVDGKVTGLTKDSPAYRVAMRSVVDSAVAAVVGPAIAGAAEGSGIQSTGSDGIDPQTLQALQALQRANGGMPGAVPVTNPALNGAPQPPPGPIPTDPATAAVMRQIGAQLPANTQMQPGRIRTDPSTAAVMSQIGVSAASPAGNEAMPAGTGNDVFVPQVRGPNDPVQGATPPPVATPSRPAVDNADVRNGGTDDAFVF
jgi:type IV secretion system protein VirB1